MMLFLVTIWCCLPACFLVLIVSQNFFIIISPYLVSQMLWFFSFAFIALVLFIDRNIAMVMFQDIIYYNKISDQSRNRLHSATKSYWDHQHIIDFSMMLQIQIAQMKRWNVWWLPSSAKLPCDTVIKTVCCCHQKFP